MAKVSKNKQIEWVTILGEEIPIEYVDRVDAENNLGEMDCVNRKIKLKRGLSLEATRRVRIHEKTHALLRLSGIAAGIPDNIEEMICDLMELGYKAYKDEIMEELTEKDK